MITPAQYVSDRVGLPYAAHDLNCWELTRRTQMDLFGRGLPVVGVEDGGHHMTLLARAFKQNEERARWRQIASPVNGAIVLMSRPGRITAVHCGTYLDLDGGGIFHTDEDHGVQFDSVLDVALRNWVPEYFVPR